MNDEIIHFYKVHPNGWNQDVPDPTKAHPSDAGWDIHLLTCIKYDKKSGISMWDTGIVVEPPEECYTMLIARSSLHKYGYQLANGVGVIDRNYRNSIKVVLQTISGSEIIPIIPPFKAVQLIIMPLPPFKPMIHTLTQKEFSTLQFSTERGGGGFGSTNKKENTDHLTKKLEIVRIKDDTPVVTEP